ncbi:MAG: 4'-phosphopantetheinyl transferase superfamily protein [Calditrichaeota bacterium]|nr:4'-phosphopantetheinyl transferase superfamily protein [Calditrichota bacterium]
MSASADHLVGIGCDTEHTERFASLLAESDRFLQRWFTVDERQRFLASDNHELCILNATLLFTLKECVIKALWRQLPLLPDAVEVLDLDHSTDHSGSASVRLARPECPGIRFDARFRQVDHSFDSTVLAFDIQSS